MNKRNKRLIGFATAAESLAGKLENDEPVHLAVGDYLHTVGSEKEYCAIGMCLRDAGVPDWELLTDPDNEDALTLLGLDFYGYSFTDTINAFDDVYEVNDAVARNLTSKNRKLLARRLHVLSNLALVEVTK